MLDVGSSTWTVNGPLRGVRTVRSGAARITTAPLSLSQDACLQGDMSLLPRMKMLIWIGRSPVQITSIYLCSPPELSTLQSILPPSLHSVYSARARMGNYETSYLLLEDFLMSQELGHALLCSHHHLYEFYPFSRTETETQSTGGRKINVSQDYHICYLISTKQDPCRSHGCALMVIFTIISTIKFPSNCCCTILTCHDMTCHYLGHKMSHNVIKYHTFILCTSLLTMSCDMSKIMSLFFD